MTCTFCSAPLPKKGLICEYCGKRNPLNLKVLSKIEIERQEASHSCPTCDVTCDNINIGRTKRIIIQRCNDCDGLFLGEDILEELVKAQSVIKEKIDLQILRFIKDHPRPQKETVIRYKRCPVCDSMMHRLNYRAVSGVIVDKCHKHGIWLDAGELLQLYEWKKAGGDLQKSQEEKSEINLGDPSFRRPHKEDNQSFFNPLGDFLEWIQGA